MNDYSNLNLTYICFVPKKYYNSLINSKGGFMSNLNFKAFLPVVVLLVLWFIPAPEGLSANAWHFLAIFFAVVVGLIVEPVPAALVGFAGVSLVALLGLVGNPKESITWALSGFSNSVIW